MSRRTQRTNSAGASFANSYSPMGHTKGYDDQAASNSDVTYVYSTDDQLISRLEPTAPADRAKTTLYFYDPITGALSEEADGAGNTLVRYLNDADGQALAQQGYRIASSVRDVADTAGTWKWLLQDVNGNVATHVLDNQDVVEQATWDPYGRPEKAGSSQTDIKKKGSTLGFQGAITDKVTGNLVLGPRQYDTSTARFITPDVFVGSELDIGLEVDPLTGNRYLFAAANPVAYYDDGHHPNKRPSGGESDEFTFNKRQARGQIRIGLFIPTRRAAAGALRGDARDWDWNTNPGNNRIYIDLHLETGEGFISANPTCTGEGDRCDAALPWNASKGRSNRYWVKQLNDGTLEVKVKGRNSILPGLAIDATFRIDRKGNVTYLRDDYPALEIYRVRRGRKSLVTHDEPGFGGFVRLIGRARRFEQRQ